MTGEPPDADAWSSFAGQVLAVLLAQPVSSRETLERIEAKVDQVALQDYHHSLEAALEHLASAQRAWRTPSEREQALEDARGLLIRATVAAPGPDHKAPAKLYLGITWLLSGSLADAQLALADAAESLGEAHTLARRYVLERTLNRTPKQSAADDATWRAFGGQPPERPVLSFATEPDMGAAIYRERLASVQQARRLLGVHPTHARMPPLSGENQWDPPLTPHRQTLASFTWAPIARDG